MIAGLIFLAGVACFAGKQPLLGVVCWIVAAAVVL